jgi:hypothetical protein
MNEHARHRCHGLLQTIWCAGILLLLIVLEWRWFQRGVLSEHPPMLDFPHELRAIVIAVAAWLGLRGCIGMFSPDGNKQSFSASQWPLHPVGRAAAAGIPLLAGVLLTVVMGIDPRLFYRWVMEDGPVETMSALMALAAGAVLARVWWLQRRAPVHPLRGIYLLGFAVACVLLAGEEVSWLQRQTGYATPAAFSGNLQGEFNLHNFVTNHMENAYYLTAFAAAVFGAFLREACNIGRAWPWISGILPGRLVAYAGALGAGFNYEMWNTIPTQLTFFSTMAILLWFARHGRGAPGGTWLPLAVLLVLLAGQLISLALGHTMIRPWDGTEVKEFFMPMSFLLYALELRARLGRDCADIPA